MTAAVGRAVLKCVYWPVNTLDTGGDGESVQELTASWQIWARRWDDGMMQWSGWVFISRGCDRAEGRLAWFPLPVHEISDLREWKGTRRQKRKEGLEKHKSIGGREMKRNCYTSPLKLRCYHLFIHSHFAGSLEILCFEARGVTKITVIFQQV